MDSALFQFDDDSNSDVKLHIILSDGHPYPGNPIKLHSAILNKSSYFEARLSKRWSDRDASSSSSEVVLKLPRDASAENWIDCIRLMYSSQRERRHLSFTNVDDALRILPVASEWLFEEGIQACTKYLAAVSWTPQQKLRIQDLQSSFKVIVSADLAERLKISKSVFDKEVEKLRSILPQMLSPILNKPFVPNGVPLQHMQETVKRHLVAYFQEDIHPAIQKTCTDFLLEEFRKRIENVKCNSEIEIMGSACESLLWLLDLIRLCKTDVFEAAFEILVEEDESIADVLAHPEINWDRGPESARLYYGAVIQILVHTFLEAVANGDIILSRLSRISFLTKWVPVMGYLICCYGHVLNDLEHIGSPSSSNIVGCLEFNESFERGVTKILASLPMIDQIKILDSFSENAAESDTVEWRAGCWWINSIRMSLVVTNGSHRHKTKFAFD